MVNFRLHPAVYSIERFGKRRFMTITMRLDTLFCEWIEKNAPHLTPDVMEFTISPVDWFPNTITSGYEVYVRIDPRSKEIVEEATLLSMKYGD